MPLRPGNGAPSSLRTVLWPPSQAARNVARTDPPPASAAVTPSSSCVSPVRPLPRRTAPPMLAQPRLQDCRQPVLRDEDAVRVPGAPRARVEGHRQAGEVRAGPVAGDCVGLDRVDQAAHRQHLGRPRVDPAAPGLGARFVVPLDEGDVGPGEGQLGCEHHAGGAGADDENGSVHGRTLPSAEMHRV